MKRTVLCFAFLFLFLDAVGAEAYSLMASGFVTRLDETTYRVNVSASWSWDWYQEFAWVPPTDIYGNPQFVYPRSGLGGVVGIPYAADDYRSRFNLSDTGTAVYDFTDPLFPARRSVTVWGYTDVVVESNYGEPENPIWGRDLVGNLQGEVRLAVERPGVGETAYFTVVPEPASVLLLMLALGVLAPRRTRAGSR